MIKLKTIFVICLGVLLMNCVSCVSDTSRVLEPLGPADRIEILTNGLRAPIAEIIQKEKIEELISFVNALPQKWAVPSWYGPPVGKVYFNLYDAGKFYGNFYVGPNFFGRDVSYGHDNYDFLSQAASKAQINALGNIVGFDLQKYFNEER